MKFIQPLFLAAVAALIAAASTADAQPTPPVRVDSCAANAGSPGRTWSGTYGHYAPYGYYTNGRYMRGTGPYMGHAYSEPSTPPTLAIGFANTSPKTATTVDFGLIAKGHNVAIVRDVGTFTTGAKIEHVFSLSPNVFPLGTSLYQCLPLHITYTDGTVWNHP
jgi:hypothetical protein